MRYLLFSVFLLTVLPVQAGEIIPLPEDYMIKQPIDIANIDISMSVDSKKDINQEIIYMMNNYSLEDMALYAVRINKADRQAAQAAGRPLPAKLSRETLQDKELIAKYLRSRYNLIK